MVTDSAAITKTLQNPTNQCASTNLRVTPKLYAGFNDEADLITDGPIDQLAAALPDFRAEVCLWTPNGGDGWWGFTGTPVDAVKRDLAGLNEPPDVYVCGPPALIEAAEDALVAGGVPASQIFAERITAN
jgi:NAD(P)H-flavin reductase